MLQDSLVPRATHHIKRGRSAKVLVYMQIAAGKDADLLLLDEQSLEIKYVYAKGQLVRTPEWVRGGMFERGDRIHPIKPQVFP